MRLAAILRAPPRTIEHDSEVSYTACLLSLCQRGLWCWKDDSGCRHSRRSEHRWSYPEDYGLDQRECGFTSFCRTPHATQLAFLDRKQGWPLGRLHGSSEWWHWKTRLDIELPRRAKQIIVGCGGGFRRECANRYSPVA